MRNRATALTLTSEVARSPMESFYGELQRNGLLNQLAKVRAQSFNEPVICGLVDDISLFVRIGGQIVKFVELRIYSIKY